MRSSTLLTRSSSASVQLRLFLYLSGYTAVAVVARGRKAAAFLLHLVGRRIAAAVVAGERIAAALSVAASRA